MINSYIVRIIGKEAFDMRSPGVIYRRYRQIKKKIIYDKMSEAYKKSHCNCKYAQDLVCKDYQGEKSLKTCGFRIEVGVIELCDNPVECNAFICKWSKEKNIKETEKEMSDPYLKKKLYPELILMEWVLDKSLHDALKEPNIFGKVIIKCISFLENLLKSIN